MALIIFSLSAPLLAVLGIGGPAGETVPVLFSNVSISDWGGLLAKGMGMFAIGILAQYVGFRINAGAMIFAVVFTVSTLPLQATLDFMTTSYGVPSVITGDPLNPATAMGIIPTAMWFVFVFAFIQISGSGGTE